jgi:hypothetical protein
VRLPTTALLASALFTAVLARGEYTQFPGAPTDSRTLRIKEKVEEIYSSGNYERALFIYQKELAPRGDKYAQYMVGYMHLTGQGAKENAAEALAWYRLAAERGEPKFLQARDALEQSLAAAVRERSAARFSELRQRYGDRRLILDLIREDLIILGRRDGIAGAGPGARMESDYSGSRNGNPYFRRVRAQLAERLRYLDAMPDDAGVDAEPSGVDALEASVRRELRDLDLP